MRHTFHIATGQYEFIEQIFDGTTEDAVAAYKELQRAWKGGDGLGMKEFAKVVMEYCKTGAIVDGGNYDFSANERVLLNELKKLNRKDN